jgi:hypothetical protein
LVDVASSSPADLLPDRWAPELLQLQAELSDRHSYWEAARLLTMLLPWHTVNHTTLRNRTHRAAADLERPAIAPPKPQPDIDPAAKMVVLIDGAHVRAALCPLLRRTCDGPNDKAERPIPYDKSFQKSE